MSKKKKPPAKKKGAPAYMVSFGDMMTLILCFFILLVSMADEQNFGLLARGVGSFIVAVESHGLNGVLDGQEKKEIFDNVRRRFNLPPEEDPERRETHISASQYELIRADLLESLEPRSELRQPNIANFEPDSAALTDPTRAYLDSLADTLRPAPGQTLMLEGHAADADDRFKSDHRWLAFMRADAVRSYLVDQHRFNPMRVQAKAWYAEVLQASQATRTVDARLMLSALPTGK